MSDIEERLQKAGARWRLGQPTGPDPDLARITHEHRRLRVEPILGGATAVIMLAVIATLGSRGWVGESGGGRLTVPLPIALQDQVVRERDAVEAIGTVLAAPGTPLKLCLLEGVRLRGYEPDAEPAPVCSPIAVSISGVEVADLPGWTERQGVGFSSPVVVQGRWQAGTIEVDSVAAVPAPGGASPALVPCPPPAAGWIDDSFPSALEEEAALSALAAEIDAQPDLFAGFWRAPLAADASNRVASDAIVVGVAGPSEDVQSRLAELYPGNLCVTEVEYSTAQLRDVAERLATADRTWQATVEAEINRVRVSLPVFDDDALRRIADVANKVAIETLVVKK